MSKYKYNFQNVKKGQQFKDFTAFFQAITGQKPQTGAKNRAAIERELSKYISYCKASEIKPEISSKRAIIIKEIYDSPRKIDENRGRHGKYANYLKPLLLLSCGYSSYEGKMYRLANSLGIFSQYTFDQLKNAENWNRRDKMEFNPWSIKGDMRPGKEQYLRSLWNLIRTTIERNLISMQKEGILEWTYYHKFTPDILIDIDGRKERRFKSKTELKQDNKRRQRFLEEIEKDKNAILLPETLEYLNIYSKKWDSYIDQNTLKQEAYRNNMYIPSEYAVLATPEQECAIANLEQFMRQYAYKEYYKQEKFPPVEDITNEFEFFQNSHLLRIYIQLIETMYPWLIECKAIWKEVKYQVVGDASQIERYINVSSFDSELAKESLSKEFLRYMDTHLEQIMFLPTKNTLSDLKEKQFGKRTGPIMERPVSSSKSACALHEKLKQFYPI